MVNRWNHSVGLILAITYVEGLRIIIKTINDHPEANNLR